MSCESVFGITEDKGHELRADEIEWHCELKLFDLATSLEDLIVLTRKIVARGLRWNVVVAIATRGGRIRIRRSSGVLLDDYVFEEKDFLAPFLWSNKLIVSSCRT